MDKQLCANVAAETGSGSGSGIQAPAKLYYVEKRQIARGSASPQALARRSVAALSPDTDPARMLMLAWHVSSPALIVSSAERVLEALGCGASEGASQPLLSRKILRGVVSYGTVRVTTWLCLESSVPFCLPCYSAFVSYFSLFERRKKGACGD